MDKVEDIIEQLRERIRILKDENRQLRSQVVHLEGRVHESYLEGWKREVQ